MNKEPSYFYGKSQWAIILGGSSGIGLATAHRLAKEGLNLVIIHRDRKMQTQQLHKEITAMITYGIQVRTYNLDAIKVENRHQIIHELTTLFDSTDKIKVVVHAIARGTLKPLCPTISGEINEKPTFGTSVTELDFQITIEAMALSLYHWVVDLFKARLLATDTRVIALTSEGGQRAIPHYAAVGAAKGTLEALCRSIALEFAPHGIRCNVIQAGVTDTPSLRMIPNSESLKAFAQHRNPFKRLTRVEDVANAIYLLCRDESAWINGAIVPVDGGERIA